MSENFLVNFMALVKNTEIPPIFAMWSGISGISCALGRKVWVDQGIYKVYPNLYVLLVAGSGVMRKSTSISLIKKIVLQLQPTPNLIADKLTAPVLVQSLHKNLKSGSQDCNGFGFVSEMATLLTKETYLSGLGAMFTDLFDAPDVWNSETICRGLEPLKNACFGFQAAATIDWIKNGIPQEAIGGGLTSRIIFIYSGTLPAPVPRTTFTPEQKLLLQKLIETLQQIYQLSGEVKLLPETGMLYDEMYIKRHGMYKDDRLLAGYGSRWHIHLFKLATIFAASELSLDGTELVLRPNHIQAAEQALIQNESHLRHVMNLITQSERGEHLQTILNLIRSSGRATKASIMSTMMHIIGHREVMDILETLVHSGLVKAHALNSTMVYEYLGS